MQPILALGGRPIWAKRQQRQLEEKNHYTHLLQAYDAVSSWSYKVEW